MSEHNYDVIIIGGGPAGLFAGIACARNELPPLVLEKQTYPIDKACGEGIMPSGVNNFKKLGVAHFLKKIPTTFLKGSAMFPQRVVLQKQILQKVAEGVFSELSYLPHCLNVLKLYQILKYKKGLL